MLIAVTGLIGAYQAGVEWKFLPGPASCTGDRFIATSATDLSHVTAVVRCDVAAWRLFGSTAENAIMVPSGDHTP